MESKLTGLVCHCGEPLRFVRTEMMIDEPNDLYVCSNNHKVHVHELD